jgi:hypothetical protein
MDIRGAVSLISLSASLAGYLNLIETTDTKLSQLIGSELDSGINALKQANNSEKEKTSLLREARARFNKAVSLENGERLAIAYIGLAICHDCLGDKNNCLFSFEEVQKIEPVLSRRDILMVTGSAVTSFPLVFFAAPTYLAIKKHRLDELEKIKSYSKEYLDKINKNITRIHSLDGLMV